MKGLFRFLLLGALLLGVTSVMASGHVHKVEISKSCDDYAFVLDHQFDVTIERVDNEVLVIRNEDDAVKGISKPVEAVANAPPRTGNKVKRKLF